MTPLKIGACLKTSEIADHRDWLFDDGRDIELQDFMSHAALTTGFDDCIAAAKTALDGHTGRLGIHGPFEGLDIDNKDAELRSIITARFLKALEAADRIGARQMVLHSPYTAWYQNNIFSFPGYAESKIGRIHQILDPVVRAAEDMGILLWSKTFRTFAQKRVARWWIALAQKQSHFPSTPGTLS